MFETVRVELADQPGPDGVTPVEVTVVERLRRFLGAGVSFSTSEGFAGRLYWGHRNLFGGAERLRITGEIAGVDAQSAGENGLDETDFTLQANFVKPDFLWTRQSLELDLSGVTDNPPAYKRNAGILSARLAWEITDRLTFRYGVESQTGVITTKRRDYDVDIVGAPLSLAYDASDNLLNPTEGFRLTADAAPWLPMGDDSGGGFLAARVSGTAYWGFDEAGRTVLAGRLAAGSISGAALDDIPPDKRFYAGGGGSVRGFGFQKVGPRDAFGDPVGGRSLVEGSVELRLNVTDTIGLVPFIDAGAVYGSAYPDFSEPFRVSAGLGVRYFTNFGPLRVDVGVPLNRERNDSRWELYLSLGQAFLGPAFRHLFAIDRKGTIPRSGAYRLAGIYCLGGTGVGPICLPDDDRRGMTCVSCAVFWWRCWSWWWSWRRSWGAGSCG